MNTTTVTTSADLAADREPRPEQPVYSVSLFVDDDTVIETNIHPGSIRLGTVTNGYVSIMANPNGGGDTAEASFDMLERFLLRCRAALDSGRHRLAVENAKKLPCGGVCNEATWSHSGTWYCGAVHPDRAVGCTREEGHDGEHISCSSVDGHTVRARWTNEAAA